ncbi:MAG: lytic transglycosylase domain-containing protein [Amylibacter sp.]|nr:lytic transglycosylase domain-containing protein [Amylibacter sp.]
MRKSITVFIAIMVIGKPIAASADILKSPKSNERILSAHSKLIDKRLSKQYSNSNRLFTIKSDRFGSIPIYTGKYKGVYKPMAEAAARKYGIPIDLFNRLVQQESNWNPKTKSQAGAIGLAQLMPLTAKSLGVDPYDPRQNLEGGARYLKQQYDKFRSWRLALAAYNAGPSIVEKHGGVPPYNETRNYVRQILGQ